MAVRRGLANFADTYLKFYLQKKLAEDQAEAVASRQRGLETQRHTNDLYEKAIADPSGRISNQLGLEQLQPTAQTLMQPIIKRLSEAKDRASIQDQGTMVAEHMGNLGTAGHDTSQLPMKSQELKFQDGDITARALVPDSRPDIKQLIALRQGKIADQSSADEYKMNLAIGEAGGVQHEKNLINEQDTAAFHPAQLGREKLEQNQATDSFINQGQRELKELGPGRVKQAGAVAQAQGFGSEAGQIQAREKYKDLYAEQQRRTGGNITDTQRAIAGQMLPLVQAHSKLTNLENKGVGLKMGATFATSIPFGADISKYAGMFSDDELLYAQGGVEWTNVAGKIISGVAVRADERSNFYGAMITNQADPEPLKLAKQRAREAFAAAAEIGAGGAKDLAGMALGRAIKSGDLDANILKMLELDPAVMQGVASGLRQ